MKGFIRRRGDAWELRVYLGVDPVSGKQRYASRTVRAGKREAQRVLAAMVVDADRGAIARTSATLGQLLDEWLEQAERDFSPKTVRETRGFIERTIRPELGDVSVARLRPITLDRFYAKLIAPGGGRAGAGLSPATVRRVHGIIRRALAQGVRWGWLGVNPAASASPPRVPATTIQPPTPAELALLLDAAERRDPELETFLVLSAATGARRSELVALRWPDIDFGRRVVTIRRGIVLGPLGLEEKDTKTHQARRVTLDEATTNALVRHRHTAVEQAAIARMTLADDGFVFTSDLGATPWFPDSVSRRFRTLARELGLPTVRLHDIRHYVATRLLTAGVDVRTVAGRLGHRDAATTLNVYSHFLPEADQKAAEVLARLLDGERQ
jgi:integrase